ncbi:MAG: transglycosylase [Alphaproteobacteria bacterium]|nr:transglycosylase [Alphaproteobacteria bacterium]
MFALGVVLSTALAGQAQAASLQRTQFSALNAWPGAGVQRGFAAFVRSCRAMLAGRTRWPRRSKFGGSKADWKPVCQAAARLGAGANRAQSAGFFQKHFQPVVVRDSSSLFTGYFEPELEGSLRQKPGYGTPLLRKPADLVRTKTKGGYGRKTSSGVKPHFTRKQIERGALRGRGLELIWLKDPTDAFFLHIQGSGRVRLDTGGALRVGFAAKNGRPYTPIGKILIERGEIARENISMQSIRAWLLLNAGKAQELFWKNQSYIFFRKSGASDPNLGPAGAQGVQLTPEHSLAVDRRYTAYGTPLWLETRVPTGSGGNLVPFARVMVAQDTGTAIKGPVRGDVFFGSGERAGYAAGLMQSPGRLVLLLPKALARRLAR